MTEQSSRAGFIAFSSLVGIHLILSLLSVDYRLIVGGFPARWVASILDLKARGGGDVIPGQAMAAFRLINWVLVAEGLLLLYLASRFRRLQSKISASSD